MNWKIALLVALLTAVATAIVTAFVADKVTTTLGMSDFEGKRGYAVAFLFIPAGFIGGFLLGLLGTKLVGAVAWSQFWKAAGLSLLLGQVALFAVAALSLLGRLSTPAVAGRNLAVELEVHLPLALMPPSAWEPYGTQISFYAGDNDNQLAHLDTARTEERDGRLILHATADLRSTTGPHGLSVNLNEGPAFACDLPLAQDTAAADTAWSPLQPMYDARSTGGTGTDTGVRVRYRVVDFFEEP
jgi:hypothetical protein